MSENVDEGAMDLVGENASLRAENEILRAENADLKARIEKLEAQVGQNPRNSSVPPSSEGLAKPNRAARRAGKRRPGKQPGSEGHRLEPVSEPNKVVVHAPPSCRNCGKDLSSATVTGTEARQVFDLPPIRPHVTEHRMETRRCGCGCETKAEAPSEAIATTCYGSSVRGLVLYLAVYQHLPYDRMRQMFEDVFGLGIAEGTLANIVAEAGGRLGLFSQVVEELLKSAPAVHFDETGARVEGSLHWIHVASTALYTLLHVDKKRGRIAMDTMGILSEMHGVAVHDAYHSYDTFDLVHALCNAHVVRELQGVVDNLEQAWAEDLIALLVAMKEAVDEAKAKGKTALPTSMLHAFRSRYGRLVAEGKRENPTQGCGDYKGARLKAYNLVRRLDQRKTDYLRFLVNFLVCWDNNQAERDIRMVKLQQKISGCWRTRKGAETFCEIRSYISTMRKHGADVLAGLRGVFTGDVWLPPTPTDV